MKKILFLLVVCSLAFTGCKKKGCMETAALNYDPKAKQEDGSCEFPPGIGSSYQGGIIFYVDGNGGGLIAAPTDQSAGTEWGCYPTLINGADGTAVGTGSQNTIDIEAGCPNAGTAADICANLTLGGYSDWFLPSKDELNLMYVNLHQQGLGDYGPTNYWSSTESDFEYARYFSFYDGYAYYTYKYYSNSVRAVRAF